MPVECYLCGPPADIVAHDPDRWAAREDIYGVPLCRRHLDMLEEEREKKEWTTTKMRSNGG